MRAATRKAGRSMVVVTEYEFDVAGWRSTAGPAPAVIRVDVGTAGHAAAWSRLPLSSDVDLRLDDDGPAGIRRVVLRAAAEPAFTIGDVAFESAR